jgi:hypothetical protein
LPFIQTRSDLITMASFYLLSATIAHPYKYQVFSPVLPEDSPENFGITEYTELKIQLFSHH